MFLIDFLLQSTFVLPQKDNFRIIIAPLQELYYRCHYGTRSSNKTTLQPVSASERKPPTSIRGPILPGHSMPQGGVLHMSKIAVTFEEQIGCSLCDTCSFLSSGV